MRLSHLGGHSFKNFSVSWHGEHQHLKFTLMNTGIATGHLGKDTLVGVRLFVVI
jgi:hypothetical protein